MILDREAIMELLPHRDPFLFVDGVTEIDEGKSVKAFYSFPADSFFFKGHFPGHPIVPGVLLVEAMAQVAGILAYRADGSTYRERGARLLRMDRVVFRGPVGPNEKVVMEAVLERRRGPVSKFVTKAYVDGKIVSEATITATFFDPDNSGDN